MLYFSSLCGLGLLVYCDTSQLRHASKNNTDFATLLNMDTCSLQASALGVMCALDGMRILLAQVVCSSKRRHQELSQIVLFDTDPGLLLGQQQIKAKNDSQVTSKLIQKDCLHNDNNTNNNNLQAFQLIVLARYLLGVPKPSPVSRHALT